MNELQIFSNPEFGTVRTLLIEDEPWAVGKDVAKALGYSNTKDALAKHVDPEDRQVIQRSQITTFAIPPRGMSFINESGMYSLILSSKLPDAKKFKRWVTSEILPTLRRTGRYTMQGAEQQPEERPLTADDYLTAARILSGCRNERLPYVLPLIRKAGIDIEIAKPTTIPKSGKDPQTARLLTAAINQYNVSTRELERLTGISTTQIYRMRNGTSRYNEARAAIIRDVLHALAPELNQDEYTTTE